MGNATNAQEREATKRVRELEDFEDAATRAFNTGKADRAQITREAQEAGAEALRLVGDAMERDKEAAEAERLAIITEASNDRTKIRAARRRARAAHKEAKRTHRQATAAAKESYQDIKFSEPGKLGFMRVVQVSFAVHIILVLGALLLTSRDTIVYDSVTVTDWISIILEGVAFWFFVNYYKAARPFMMIFAALDVLMFVVVHLLRGDLSVGATLAAIIVDGLIIIYFWRSKRVKQVLVNDFSSLDFKPSGRVRVQRKGWPFIRNLTMYFIIFSVLGHWMEAAMCQLIRLGLVQGEYDPTNTMLWRDWLYPYPMEGAAVVIIALVLYPLWQRLLEKYSKQPIIAYLISFAANALTCTIIEFSMGLIVNANHQLWDYTENFGNIMGQVCLQNTLAFGVAASLIAWFVYPAMERWLARMPNDVLNIAFVVIAVIGGILWSLYIVDPPQNHIVQNTEEAAVDAEDMETSLLTEQIVAVETEVEDLQTILDSNGTLSDKERAEVQEKIDKLRADAKELDELELGKAA